MQQTANFDQPVMALAKHHPLLFQDLQAWIQANPASTRLAGLRQEPLSIPYGTRNLLFHWSRPEQILKQLDESGDGTTIQVFSEVSSLLQFLTQPAAIDCIAHPKWLPLLLLPLQHAPHIQQWLLKTPPSDWPWPLLERSRFPDEATGQLACSVGQQMQQFLQQIASRLAQQLASRYENRPTPAQILREKQRPLRVLTFALIDSAYQRYCARDMADALGECRVDAKAFIPKLGPATHYDLLKTIETFDPDVLVLNGRERRSYPFLPKELCMVAWDQDYVLCHDPDQAKTMGPRDRLLVLMKEWRQDAISAGVSPSRAAHLDLGANPRIYYPSPTSQTPEYDVLFVGNIHQFDNYRKLIGFDTLDPVTQQLMLHARERLSAWVSACGENEPFVLPDLDPFLRQCLAEIGQAHVGDPAHWRSIVYYFRYRVAHLVLREMYVSALTEFRLGLFGRGWETFPAVARFAQPEIANGEPLREAIGRSAINLHLHTWTVHHPRLYDTAAAGGFLLVGRIPEEDLVSASFTPGSELDTFGSIAELKRKIRYYLDHPDERLAMAARAAQRARSCHTMQHRMAELVQYLSKDIDDQQS